MMSHSYNLCTICETTPPRETTPDYLRQHPTDSAKSLSLKGLVIGPKISIATKADYLIDFLQKQDGNVDQF